MEKDFNSWNIRKNNIHLYSNNKFYRAREIWWCAVGVNIGFEQDGSGDNRSRPVLIIKGMSKETCLVIPLTTSKNRHKLRYPIGTVDGREASALLSQMKTIDTKRLIVKITDLDKNIYTGIRKAVKKMF